MTVPETRSSLKIMGDQLALLTNVSGPVTPEPDRLSRSSACDYYPIMMNPERDAPERFQGEVSKLKDRFDALDKEVRAGGKVIVRGIGQMIPALAKMEPFLSRKGEDHEPHHVKMLIAAGLPTWEDYKRQVAAEFEISVRTVQRKLEEHRGYPKEHQPRRLSSGRNRSRAARKPRLNPTQAAAQATAAKNLADAKKQLGAAAAAGSAEAATIIAEYEQAAAAADSSALIDSDVDPVGDDADDDSAEFSPLAGYDGCGEVKSAADLLAEHAKMMLDVLTGTSVMSDSMRITRAATLVKDLQCALIEGKVGSDRVRGAYATLGSAFIRMADTADTHGNWAPSKWSCTLPAARSG